MQNFPDHFLLTWGEIPLAAFNIFGREMFQGLTWESRLVFISPTVLEITTILPVIFVILAGANSLSNCLKKTGRVGGGLRLDCVPAGYKRAAICEDSKCC